MNSLSHSYCVDECDCIHAASWLVMSHAANIYQWYNPREIAQIQVQNPDAFRKEEADVFKWGWGCNGVIQCVRQEREQSQIVFLSSIGGWKDPNQ